MSTAAGSALKAGSLEPKMISRVKLHSPYEAMMRNFSEAYKEQCSSVVVDLPAEERPKKEFVTGSKYKGTWDVLGMSGSSVTYTFPNGVIYQGDFEDGLRQGNGEMHYPTGEIIKGKYRNGHMVERTLIFADGLEYSDSDWMYCKTPDRRFTIEYEKGVMPAGKSYMTAEQPTRVIPPGYYDTGDGFYDPKTTMVYNADDLTAILRSPSDAERKWIVENCRKAPTEPIGPRPDLYEDWLEPETKLESVPLPAAVSTATAWMFDPNRSMTSYDSDDSNMVSCSDFTKWLRNSRLSSIQKPPTLKTLKAPTSGYQSRSLSIAENSATPENRPRLQSIIKNSATLENRPRLQSDIKNSTTPENRPRLQSVLKNSATPENGPRLKSLVEESVTPGNSVRARIRQSSVFEKSKISTNSEGSRLSVGENSTTSETLIKFRPTRRPTVARFL